MKAPSPLRRCPWFPTRITANQVIAGLLLLFALRYAQGVLAPLMLALLGSLALAPPVRALSRVIPRWIASAVVVIVIASAFGTTAYLLSDEVSAFSRRLPSLVRDMRAAVQSASPRQGLLRQLQQAVSELERSTDPPRPTDATPVTIVEPVDVQRGMLSGARSLASYLGQGVMLLFLVYFLLASGDMFKQKLVKLGGARLSERKITLQMIEEINTKIGRFIFYQAWSGLLVGLLTWLAFSMARRPLRRVVGRGGGRAEHRAVRGSHVHHGRVGGGGDDPVQVGRHGGARGRRLGGHHRRSKASCSRRCFSARPRT